MKVSGQIHLAAALPLEKNPGTHWLQGFIVLDV